MQNVLPSNLMNSSNTFFKQSSVNNTTCQAPVPQPNEGLCITLLCCAIQVVRVEEEDVLGKPLNVVSTQVEVVLCRVRCTQSIKV